MKPQVLLALLMVIGCSTTERATAPATLPKLLSSTPLPPLTLTSSALGLRLNVEFRIRADGTVREVNLLTPSGDAQWDSLAVQSMKRWRFTRPSPAGAAADRMIRYPVIVQPGTKEPLFMTLGELPAATEREADSLYALLETGADFDSLARHARIPPAAAAGDYIRTMDVASFPPAIRDRVRCLREDEISRPIRLGSGYVIYRRYRAGDLPQVQ